MNALAKYFSEISVSSNLMCFLRYGKPIKFYIFCGKCFAKTLIGK